MGLVIVNPVSAARSATRAALASLNAVAGCMSKEDDRERLVCARSLYDSIESFTARARSGPQLLASWGPASFLLFIASKAVRAGNHARRLLEKFMESLGRASGGGAGQTDDEDGGGDLSGTDAGYAAYALTLIHYHMEAGLLGYENQGFERLLDSMVSLYLDEAPEGGRVRPSYTGLMAYVQAVGRFAEIYTWRILSVYERGLRSVDDANKFLGEVRKVLGGGEEGASGT